MNDQSWDDLIRNYLDYEKERLEWEDALGISLPPKYAIRLSQAAAESLAEDDQT